MAAQGNWLSFSQYPLDTTFRSTVSFDNNSDFYNQYLFNSFYGNEESIKQQQPHYPIPNSEETKQPQIVDLSNLSSHFNPQVPKLEDFLSLSRYSDTQTLQPPQTQDDSDNNKAYQPQELKPISVSSGFHSGSEVEDSGSATGNRNNELMLCDNSQSLSLGVGQNADNHAIVPADTPKALTSDTFGQRTSVYRGVTRHRWTGRYEAHLWDNSCRREGQSRKGRQVYLGGYDKEDKAARAYDLAALKYWGPGATTNFPVTSYAQELEEMKNMTKQEFIASLRRKSSGFSRGASVYRGVTRHHQQGRWQARIGRVAGNKDLYLGTFGTEEEAAEAYDIAAIKFRGLNAVTNFEMNRYDVEAIANSALPIGAVAKRLKLSLDADNTLPISAHEFQQPQSSNCSTSVVVHPNVSSGMSYEASMAMYHHNLLQHYHSAPVCSSDSTSTAVTSMALMPQPEFTNRNFEYGFTTPLNMDSQYSSNETDGNYLNWNMGSSSN